MRFFVNDFSSCDEVIVQSERANVGDHLEKGDPVNSPIVYVLCRPVSCEHPPGPVQTMSMLDATRRYLVWPARVEQVIGKMSIAPPNPPDTSESRSVLAPYFGGMTNRLFEQMAAEDVRAFQTLDAQTITAYLFGTCTTVEAATKESGATAPTKQEPEMVSFCVAGKNPWSVYGRRSQTFGAIRHQASKHDFRIAVVGAADGGKCSLINALFGLDLAIEVAIENSAQLCNHHSFTPPMPRCVLEAAGGFGKTNLVRAMFAQKSAVMECVVAVAGVQPATEIQLWEGSALVEPDPGILRFGRPPKQTQRRSVFGYRKEEMRELAIYPNRRGSPTVFVSCNHLDNALGDAYTFELGGTDDSINDPHDNDRELQKYLPWDKLRDVSAGRLSLCKLKRSERAINSVWYFAGHGIARSWDGEEACLNSVTSDRHFVPLPYLDQIISYSLPSEHLCIVNAVTVKREIKETSNLPYSNQLMNFATLDRVEQKEERKVKTPKTLGTSNCPSLGRFEEAEHTGWSALEQDHLDSCRICQRIIEVNYNADEEGDDDDPSFSTGDERTDEVLAALKNGTYEEDQQKLLRSMLFFGE